MHAIILIVLVSTTQGLQSCYDFCDSVSSGLSNAIWRPDCNCISRQLQQNRAKTAWIKKYLMLQYKDSGIYYEPTEINNFSSLSAFGNPFYISNPINRINKKRSNNENYYSSTNNKIHTLSSEPHKKRNRKLKRKESPIRGINVETNKLPLYLDIDIYKTTNDGRSSSENLLNDKIEEFYYNQNHLTECMDLHILVSLRRNTTKSGDVLYNKFKQYENYTDTDLRTEIKKKCNETVDILNHYLKEIKSNIPKKQNTNVFVEPFLKDYINISLKENVENKTNTNVTDNSSNSNTGNKEESEIIKSTHNDDTFDARTEHYDIEQKLYVHTTSRASDDILQLSQEDSYLNQSILIGENLTTTSVRSNVKVEDEDFTTYSPSHIIIIDDETKRESIEDISTTLSSPSSLKTIAKPHINMEETRIDDDFSGKFLEQSTEIDIQGMLNPTKKSEGIKYGNNNNAKNLSKHENEIKSKIIETDNLLVSTDIPVNQINHTVYLEEDLRMPKIITKEFSNGSISSELKGDESLPNADFNNNDIVAAVKFNERIFNNKSNRTKVISKLDDENVTISSNYAEITGKLYFIYGQHQIPARFIQKTNGELKMGIDGISLCKELDINRGKSMMTLLCKCIQHHNCSNSYLEDNQQV